MRNGYVVVPAGTYLLGDPCYSIEGDDWDTVLNTTNFFETEGKLPDGRFVMAFSTAYGDGGYTGSNGFEYCVDAGLIGLVEVPEGYVNENDLVTLITFERDTIVYGDNGVMDFGSVSIDTAYEETDEEDENDYWSIDDDED